MSCYVYVASNLSINFAGLDDKSKDRKLFKKFVSTYLRDDGVFLLRSVGNNSSDIILLELIRSLYTSFKKENMSKDDAYVPTTRDETYT